MQFPKRATNLQADGDSSSLSHEAKRAGLLDLFWRYEAIALLGFLVGCFLLIESLIPLGTAVQIGADEGFELVKATLCLKGHRLYTEVWNDQPPLHTFLITQILKHVSPSILGPRLLTVSFSVFLLSSIFAFSQWFCECTGFGLPV
jgi:hypothetical protein